MIVSDGCTLAVDETRVPVPVAVFMMTGWRVIKLPAVICRVLITCGPPVCGCCCTWMMRVAGKVLEMFDVDSVAGRP